MRWRERSSRIGIEQRRSLVQRERERERERESERERALTTVDTTATRRKEGLRVRSEVPHCQSLFSVGLLSPAGDLFG
jgi:hypothetical protein